MGAMTEDPFSLGQMKAMQDALGIAIKTGGLNDADLAHVVEVRAVLAYRIAHTTDSVKYDDALCECGHRRLHHPRSGACDAPVGFFCACVGFVLASRSVDA